MTENDLEQEIEELKKRVNRVESLLEAEPERAEEFQSLADFVDEKSPSTHNERAIVIGYYLEHFEGQGSFTVNDIEDGYQTARIPLPSNMSDVLAKCEARDWVMRVGSSGQTQQRRLTKVGITYVEDSLGDGGP